MEDVDHRCKSGRVGAVRNVGGVQIVLRIDAISRVPFSSITDFILCSCNILIGPNSFGYSLVYVWFATTRATFWFVRSGELSMNT